jgi:hypothetical protein
MMAWVEMHWGSRTALFFCREVPAPPPKKKLGADQHFLFFAYPCCSSTETVDS